jgi:hypothetical protein
LANGLDPAPPRLSTDDMTALREATLAAVAVV